MRLEPGRHSHTLPNGELLRCDRPLSREQVDLVAMLLARAGLSTHDTFLIEYDGERPGRIGYYERDADGRKFKRGEGAAEAWVTL